VILHSLSAAPTSVAFTQCVRFLREGSALLLLGDGVYAALAGTQYCDKLMGSGAELYVLEQDAVAGGVRNRLEAEITVINFDGFAALTEQFPRHQAWY